MKLSEKTRSELYRAIHDSIVDIRIQLKLPAKDDVVLAQVESAIWDKQKRVLKLPNIF
ncbi:MAG: hypothetical protein PHW73_10315 [Atribacterota bacterium]|nr:hypothetical protein [Atribacterota bacterium]